MGAFVFNIAKGRFARYAALPETNDQFIAVILKSAGLESDATLKDYDDLSTLLAAANDEATFAGYARYTLTGVTATIDDTNDWVLVDCNDPVWSPTAAEAIGAILFVYDNDTTAGTDANIVLVFKDDFALTTATSGTLTYQVATGGFAKAA